MSGTSVLEPSSVDTIVIKWGDKYENINAIGAIKEEIGKVARLMVIRVAIRVVASAITSRATIIEGGTPDYYYYS